ncbi:MAG: hypothetical protein AABY64_02785 [Bdellovibrionota bacterium]
MTRNKSLILILSYLLISCVQVQTIHSEGIDAEKVLVSDWDDTIAYMPTKIFLFKKHTGETLEVSTGEYANEGKAIGKKGKYLNYQIKNESFKFFSVAGELDDQESYFKDDVVSMLQRPQNEWKGPYFDNVIKMLSNPQTAELTYILTARGHSSYEIMLGLNKLKSHLQQTSGLQIMLPPEQNLLMVSAAADVPKKKGEEMVRLIRKYAGTKVKIIEFVDDDFKNTDAVAKAVAEIQNELKIKIIVTHVSRNSRSSVVFTGLN